MALHLPLNGTQIMQTGGLLSKWLIFGHRGQLGSELIGLVNGIAGDIDITSTNEVHQIIDSYSPDIVVNAAAYTSVDSAETNKDLAFAVNGIGARNIADACKHKARVIQISTDYVFDGQSVIPYKENDRTNPINIYGKSKLIGEHLVASCHPEHFIIRTAWLYGRGGFVEFVRGQAMLGKTMTALNNQFGQPTFSKELAKQIVRLGESDSEPGIYHGTNSGLTTWFGLAREIYALLDSDPNLVRPIRNYPHVARRPRFTVLGHDNWRSVEPMTCWKDSLKDFIQTTV